MTIDRAKIMAAFQPAKEISDPKRFSGRQLQIETGVELLLAKEHIFIYGPRGIGKSSLARQLEIIAKGNSELLISISSELSTVKLSFATCYLTRDESVNNINQLLYRLMIDDSAFGKFPKLIEAFGEVGEYSLESNLNPKLVADFWKRAKEISKDATDGLAIFVDEFELIRNHEGFSSLLKACPSGIIFIVTGIASTEKELVRDHKSIERQLTSGKLPVEKMQDSELESVVSTAELSISGEIRYTSGARQELVRLVSGQPYLLHLIGRESLLSSFRKKKILIAELELQEALSEIVLKKTDSGLEDRYLKAIGNSAQRETVLRIFAEKCTANAHTSAVYPLTENEGVTNPSYWAADLQKEAFGEELRKVKEQYYAFRDPLFQTYVIATPRRLIKDRSPFSANLLVKSDEIQLLHISDLHFGGTHYFNNLPSTGDSIPEQDKHTFSSCLIKSIEKHALSPNLLAITGDITQRGLTSEFSDAHQSIKKIIDKLNNSGPPPELAIIPGNHDVNWSLQAGDPESKSIAFQPYINFRNSLIDRKQFPAALPPERLYEIIACENQGFNIAVAAFNSAVLITKNDDRGYIGDGQLENSLIEIEELCTTGKWIKIALFHHHLISVPTIESPLISDHLMVDAPNIKKRLLESGFSLCLHGHRHHSHSELISDGENSMVVVGSGSSGVMNSERGSQPLQFNQIILKRIKKSNNTPATTSITISNYNFDVISGVWNPGPQKTFAV